MGGDRRGWILPPSGRRWDTLPTANPFRQCWEAFLRHVSEDAPFGANLVEGAKAVQLADLPIAVSLREGG